MKVVFVIFLLPFLGLSQISVEGVSLPLTMKSGENVLVYNGAGVREKYFMDMYVGALYLKTKNKDANTIIKSNEPMSIRLHIVSGLISSEKMIAAVDEGFRNATGEKTALLDTRIKQFKNAFSEKIKVGDIFDLIYDPAKGVNILKNGKNIGLISGLDFKSAMFGIWLCDKPADSDLKNKMLGL